MYKIPIGMKKNHQNKEEIIQSLNSITNEVIVFSKKLSNGKLNESIDDKWSINDNIEHLINSIKPLNKAHRVPKKNVEMEVW